MVIRNLSDATGQGMLTGGIPAQWIGISDTYLKNDLAGLAFFENPNCTNCPELLLWLYQNMLSVDVFWNPYMPTMKKLKVVDVRGHPNFCKDWHRKFMFDLVNATVFLKGYFGGLVDQQAIDNLYNMFKEDRIQSIWQWTDDNGNSGPVEVLSDGKCCYGAGQYGVIDADTRRSTAVRLANATMQQYSNTSLLGVDFANVCPITNIFPPSPPNPMPSPPSSPSPPPAPPYTGLAATLISEYPSPPPSAPPLAPFNPRFYVPPNPPSIPPLPPAPYMPPMWAGSPLPLPSPPPPKKFLRTHKPLSPPLPFPPSPSPPLPFPPSPSPPVQPTTSSPSLSYPPLPPPPITPLPPPKTPSSPLPIIAPSAPNPPGPPSTSPPPLPTPNPPFSLPPSKPLPSSSTFPPNPKQFLHLSPAMMQTYPPAGAVSPPLFEAPPPSPAATSLSHGSPQDSTSPPYPNSTPQPIVSNTSVCSQPGYGTFSIVAPVMTSNISFKIQVLISNQGALDWCEQCNCLISITWPTQVKNLSSKTLGFNVPPGPALVGTSVTLSNPLSQTISPPNNSLTEVSGDTISNSPVTIASGQETVGASGQMMAPTSNTTSLRSSESLTAGSGPFSNPILLSQLVPSLRYIPSSSKNTFQDPSNMSLGSQQPIMPLILEWEVMTGLGDGHVTIELLVVFSNVSDADLRSANLTAHRSLVSGSSSRQVKQQKLLLSSELERAHVVTVGDSSFRAAERKEHILDFRTRKALSNQAQTYPHDKRTDLVSASVTETPAHPASFFEVFEKSPSLTAHNMLLATTQVRVYGTLLPEVQGLVWLLPAASDSASPTEAQLASKLPIRQVILQANFSKPISDLSSSSFSMENQTLVESSRGNSNMTIQILTSGKPGQLISFYLPSSSYHDEQGRPGSNDLFLTLSIPVDDNASSSSIYNVSATVALAGSAAIASVFGASVAGTLAASMFTQILAMTANIASLGVSNTYRAVARAFRWTLLVVGGSLNMLESALGGSRASAPLSLPPPPINFHSSRRYMQATDSAMPPPPPVFSNPISSADSSMPINLIFTLIMTTLIVMAVLLAHILANFMYKRLASPKQFPAALRLPDFEFSFLGLMIVTITFYACFVLGNSTSAAGFGVGGGQALAWLLLAVLTLPYALLLWWITLGFLISSSTADPGSATCFQIQETLSDHSSEGGSSSVLMSLPLAVQMKSQRQGLGIIKSRASYDRPGSVCFSLSTMHNIVQGGGTREALAPQEATEVLPWRVSDRASTYLTKEPARPGDQPLSSAVENAVKKDTEDQSMSSSVPDTLDLNQQQGLISHSLPAFNPSEQQPIGWTWDSSTTGTNLSQRQHPNPCLTAAVSTSAILLPVTKQRKGSLPDIATYEGAVMTSGAYSPGCMREQEDIRAATAEPKQRRAGRDAAAGAPHPEAGLFPNQPDRYSLAFVNRTLADAFTKERAEGKDWDSKVALSRPDNSPESGGAAMPSTRPAEGGSAAATAARGRPHPLMIAFSPHHLAQSSTTFELSESESEEQYNPEGEGPHWQQFYGPAKLSIGMQAQLHMTSIARRTSEGLNSVWQTLTGGNRQNHAMGQLAAKPERAHASSATHAIMVPPSRVGPVAENQDRGGSPKVLLPPPSSKPELSSGSPRGPVAMLKVSLGMPLTSCISPAGSEPLVGSARRSWWEKIPIGRAQPIGEAREDLEQEILFEPQNLRPGSSRNPHSTLEVRNESPISSGKFDLLCAGITFQGNRENGDKEEEHRMRGELWHHSSGIGLAQPASTFLHENLASCLIEPEAEESETRNIRIDKETSISSNMPSRTVLLIPPSPSSLYQYKSQAAGTDSSRDMEGDVVLSPSQLQYKEHISNTYSRDMNDNHIDENNAKGDTSREGSRSLQTAPQIRVHSSSSGVKPVGVVAQTPVRDEGFTSTETYARWPALSLLLPSQKVLARFRFVFADVLEEDTNNRLVSSNTLPPPGASPLCCGSILVRKWKLAAPALNFCHKACCAAVFGYYGLQQESWSQLVGVLSLHAFMLMYLGIIFPYVSLKIMGVELLVHILEMVLIVAAIAIISKDSGSSEAMNYLMLTAFALTFLALLWFEMFRCFLIFKDLILELKAWWRTQHEMPPATAEGERPASNYDHSQGAEHNNEHPQEAGFAECSPTDSSSELQCILAESQEGTKGYTLTAVSAADLIPVEDEAYLGEGPACVPTAATNPDRAAKLEMLCPSIHCLPSTSTNEALSPDVKIPTGVPDVPPLNSGYSVSYICLNAEHQLLEEPSTSLRGSKKTSWPRLRRSSFHRRHAEVSEQVSTVHVENENESRTLKICVSLCEGRQHPGSSPGALDKTVSSSGNDTDPSDSSLKEMSAPLAVHVLDTDER
ncbi:hypothetical protein CEUSTIGMA_g11828.t1 [Chlamydomonas eustigma]|uniref:Uncharacterized protein n=1 Tax=Chlamydomonas eustigma TaxID=1157962 RepID=A0A250XN11_9CHLO|nr:hypothetical protein CEUSTIGMA_g11828.t1 [Chlamydomonas eustigma]|eukprot:GAX84406.1 hypothetical protein CEUSTIGMA_g11828.t1 [Chlamydomonas eustigma]